MFCFPFIYYLNLCSLASFIYVWLILALHLNIRLHLECQHVTHLKLNIEMAFSSEVVMSSIFVCFGIVRPNGSFIFNVFVAHDLSHDFWCYINALRGFS